MPPAVDCLVQKRHWQTGPSPVEGHQDDEGLEHMMYEKELKEQGLFNLKKKRLGVGILLSPSTTCQLVTEKMEPETHSDITRGNSRKMQQGEHSRFPKKTTGCLRKAVKCLSLEIFKTLLDKPWATLSNCEAMTSRGPQIILLSPFPLPLTPQKNKNKPTKNPARNYFISSIPSSCRIKYVNSGTL